MKSTTVKLNHLWDGLDPNETILASYEMTLPRLKPRLDRKFLPQDKADALLKTYQVRIDAIVHDNFQTSRAPCLRHVRYFVTCHDLRAGSLCCSFEIVIGTALLIPLLKGGYHFVRDYKTIKSNVKQIARDVKKASLWFEKVATEILGWSLGLQRHRGRILHKKRKYRSKNKRSLPAPSSTDNTLISPAPRKISLDDLS